MKSFLKLDDTDFKPLRLEVKIETKQDLLILSDLFNTANERLMDIVNSGLNSQSKHSLDEVKAALDPIYKALQEEVN